MSNTKRTYNITIGILSVITVGVVGYVLYLQSRKKKKILISELDKHKSPPPANVDKVESQKATTFNINKVVPSGSTATPPPFTNETEGILFREWVNDNFPKYANQINLDRRGQFNNSYIKKAWADLGGAYYYQKVKDMVRKGYGGLKSMATQTKGLIFGEGDKNIPGGDFSAKKSALALKYSMKGWGTNEKQFFGTMDKLTPAQRELTENYFNTNNVGEGETLEQWIIGDFSGVKRKKALTYIQN